MYKAPMKIDWPKISSVPVIDVDHDKHLLTIVILDPDAPSSPYLHMWYQNVTTSHPGEIVVPYMPPKPPNAAWHRYEIRVYSQGNTKRTTPIKVERPSFVPTKYGLMDADIVAQRTYTSNGSELRK